MLAGPACTGLLAPLTTDIALPTVLHHRPQPALLPGLPATAITAPSGCHMPGATHMQCTSHATQHHTAQPRPPPAPHLELLLLQVLRVLRQDLSPARLVRQAKHDRHVEPAAVAPLVSGAAQECRDTHVK